MRRSRPKEPVSARCWLSPELDPEAFFLNLRRQNVRYCVLRWFEDLPKVAAGEDLDILVSDESLPKLLEHVSRQHPEGQKMDVYSESGAMGTDWAGIPYFPKELSSFVLANVVEGPAGALVPNSEAHFLSLAYHAVFHKGFGSGLPTSQTDVPELLSPDHDYRSALLQLRDSLGRSKPDIHLDSLADFLKKKGFFPYPDVLEFLAGKNHFLSRILIQALQHESEAERGLSVFVVRETGLPRLADVRQQLELAGFEILRDISLSSSQASLVAGSTRGGNWTRGPYPRSGGQPKHVFVTADVFPLVNANLAAGRYPFSTNLRVPETKQRIRDLINRETSFLRRSNPLHSSDNVLSTEYLLGKLVGREETEALCDEVRNAFREVQDASRGMARGLGNSRRAVLTFEDSSTPGSKLVKKTFRRQHRRFFEREIATRQRLGDVPGVVGITEIGPNYFSTEFLENCHPPQVLTPAQIRATREFLQVCAARGIAPVDFSPGNLLVTSTGDLRFLDFEFFQDTASGHPISQSVALRGVGPKSSLERPYGSPRTRGHFRHKWFPYVLLPKFVYTLALPDDTVLALQQLFKRLSSAVEILPVLGSVDSFVRIKQYLQGKLLYVQRRVRSKLGSP